MRKVSREERRIQRRVSTVSRTIFLATEGQRSRQRQRNATMDRLADTMDVHGRGEEDRREGPQLGGQREAQGRDGRSKQRGGTTFNRRKRRRKRRDVTAKKRGQEPASRAGTHGAQHRNALKTKPCTKKGNVNASEQHKRQCGKRETTNWRKKLASNMVTLKMQQAQEERHGKLTREAQEDLKQKREEAGEAREFARKTVQRNSSTRKSKSQNTPDGERGEREAATAARNKDQATGPSFREAADGEGGNATWGTNSASSSQNKSSSKNDRNIGEMEARTQPDETPVEAPRHKARREKHRSWSWNSDGQRTEFVWQEV